ncbi:magnesium protoporphyrin IX methyltransferase [Acuticoccus sp.]|uniref:magnesium protoporphyrin IX methyltransferase n=1 Tax=Acuticoccus sp. TaxID=1904378 RepID=UPI003B519736
MARLSPTYADRRDELKTYFDRTAVDAWAKLTSTAKVSGIRATVRAGRDEMRATLLSYLPDDLAGARLLDAGCGTGALAVETARRGADVVATDLSEQLVGLARERSPGDVAIDWRVGDMLAEGLGEFDVVVAMDSLIHYRTADMVAALSAIAPRTRRAILITFAPATLALSAMHSVGRLFPRGDRAPAIEPVAERALRRQIARAPALAGWRVGRTHRVSKGFYTSQAMELVPA